HTININDTQRPVITGSLTPANVEGCDISYLPAAATSVAALEALPGAISIVDACTSGANLLVTHSDVTNSTCPIVITRTYTIRDACGNASTIVHTINIDDTQSPVITGSLSASAIEGCGIGA